MSVPRVVYTQDRQPKTTSNGDKQHVETMHLLGENWLNFLGITASENESEVSSLPRDKSDGTGFSFLQYAGRLAPCFYQRA